MRLVKGLSKLKYQSISRWLWVKPRQTVQTHPFQPSQIWRYVWQHYFSIQSNIYPLHHSQCSKTGFRSSRLRKSNLVRSGGCFRITAVELPTLASIILVLATSRGVVTAAENPPATAPHKEACQGFGASYRFNFWGEVIGSSVSTWPVTVANCFFKNSQRGNWMREKGISLARVVK